MPNMRERLLAAKDAEVNLHTAQKLIRSAVDKLTSIKHGVEPGLTAAKKALAECEKAYLCAEGLVKRIPADGP